MNMNRWISLFLLAALICGGFGNASAAAKAKGKSKSKKQPAAAASKSVSDREGRYSVRRDKPAQVIWGLGFEIQSDSIGSGNNGLPENPVSVPHDLVPAERTRLYKEMLKGFRYCRLALGLYLRGTDADGKRIRERYAGQMKDLVELQRESGIEGFAPEYWSPTPYWKSNGSYTGKDGTLKSFDPEFLGTMGDAMVDDVRYLREQGLKVVQWGLQNEPVAGHGRYPTCYYKPEEYLKAFKIVAPKIKAAFPEVLIHATSWDGPGERYGTLVAADPEARKYVDLWTWHRIGASSDELIKNQKKFNANTYGKPVFNNEYEYLDGKVSDDRFVNTAQSIMNWFVFADAPTFTWLHALKPTYNSEASGYSLGFWRPADDTKPGKFPELKAGHWVYNPQNFNSVAGFIRHLPWDSRRVEVSEDQVRLNNRILACLAPAGKLVLVLSNRHTWPFTFHLSAGGEGSVKDATFNGFRYTPSQCGVEAGAKQGNEFDVTLPPRSIEFWVEQ